MSSGRKVKGLLRGLRYISQIFESEKEEEIQIGNPTDVKHVAHIGWDGPTVNSPSWMNDFKTSPGFASAPLNLTGNVQSRENDNGVKWVSEDSNSSKRSSRRGQGRNLTELPKGSRRPSSGSNMDSPTKEISSDKPRQSRRSSRPKDSSDGPIRPTRLHITDSPSAQGDERSPGKAQQEIPKTTRRKKSKDSGPSKSRSKAQSPDPNFDLESPTSMSITNNR